MIVALHQRQVLAAVDVAAVDVGVELAAVAAGDRRLGDAVDERVVAQPVLDQVGDGDQLQVEARREALQVGEPRHRAVVLHDLADDAGRLEPGEPREVDRGLGLSGAHQDAAVARAQREDVARRADVARRGAVARPR